MTKPRLDEPGPANSFQCAYARLLINSHLQLVGSPLTPPSLSPGDAAHALYHADFALLSHHGGPDPVFTYGNLTAQRLFEMDWPTLTALPSRLSAESPHQAERAGLLARVHRDGFIQDYNGIRISSSGRRFHIQQATVWNIVDDAGNLAGQAAAFSQWHDVI